MLGQGGMGSVYLARHPRLQRQTALKLLNRELFADAEIRARFEREADLAAQLDHPNIVAVYDRGVEDDLLWISMQYVDGVDGATVNPHTLPPERAVQIIEGVGAALDYAHGNGVLHRDVKPANIMLARSGSGKGERVYLTDFGIARLREDSQHLTQDGMFTATLAYASPEQMMGAELDHGSDQYSLACALYWLLTATGPFDSEDPSEVIHGHLQLPVPPASARRPGLSPAMDLVIARAMAKRPADRFPSCADFAAAARKALSGPVGPTTGQMPAVPGMVPANPLGGHGYPAAVGATPGAPLGAGPASGGAPAPLGSAPAPPGVPGRLGNAPVSPGGAPAPLGSAPGGAPVPMAGAPGGSGQPVPVPAGVSGQPRGAAVAASHQPAAPAYSAAHPPGPAAYSPPPASYSRRSSSLAGWLIAGTVLLVAVLAVVIGMVAYSDDDSDDESFGTTTPARAADPVADLRAMHAAFPALAPELASDEGTGNGPGFGGKTCYATKAGNPLVQHNEGQPSLGNWVAAWDCWAGATGQPDYALLAYGSPADVHTVLARLPPNRKAVEQNDGSPYTTHRWNTAENEPRTTYYSTTSFENDPTRAHYLLYCTDDYWPSAQRGLPGPAFAEWWKTLPLR
nr:serine/threonine-protein kinase [Nocardia transvalensis]